MSVMDADPAGPTHPGSPTHPTDPVRRGGGADSPRLLREINDQLVLGLLLDHGPMTRGRIGQATGLSKPTVSSLLTRLEERGLVTTTGVVAGGPGPNARIYAVDPAAGHVIGVHVERGGSVAALANLTGEVIATGTVEVTVRRTSSPVDEITRVVTDVLGKAGLDRSAVHRVLIATPGVIDPVTGNLRHARHLHGWESPGLAQTLSDELGTTVRHGNDVNLAAVAEGQHGVAQGRSDYALLWLDRGVGLGLVLDGRLRSGAHGGAGEIGYLPVPGVPHPRVDRGGAGAFQQLVGGQGLRAIAKRHGLRGADPAGLVASAMSAGPAGAAFIEELADGIAYGAAGVATIVDPGLLVLGGPVALSGGPRLLDRVVASMRQLSFVRPQVVLSTLATDAVLRGAVEVALQSVRSQLFGRPGGLPSGLPV
jgi:predicted NBD/HSP70 family sugar kinase